MFHMVYKSFLIIICSILLFFIFLYPIHQYNWNICINKVISVEHSDESVMTKNITIQSYGFDGLR